MPCRNRLTSPSRAPIAAFRDRRPPTCPTSCTRRCIASAVLRAEPTRRRILHCTRRPRPRNAPMPAAPNLPSRPHRSPLQPRDPDTRAAPPPTHRSPPQPFSSQPSRPLHPTASPLQTPPEVAATVHHTHLRSATTAIRVRPPHGTSPGPHSPAAVALPLRQTRWTATHRQPPPDSKLPPHATAEVCRWAPPRGAVRTSFAHLHGAPLAVLRPETRLPRHGRKIRRPYLHRPFLSLHHRPTPPLPRPLTRFTIYFFFLSNLLQYLFFSFCSLYKARQKQALDPSHSRPLAGSSPES